MSIHVSHLPPGTSKWNKVEHRLFSFISINGRGRPLRTYETVINLIGNRPTEVVSSCASDSIVGAIPPARRSQRRNCEN
jgi:Rhodopirellula transposase DDE domain